MKWTKATPTKSGWYWYKEDKYFHRPLNVFWSGTPGEWLVEDVFRGGKPTRPLAEYLGEWQGPILPEHEVEADLIGELAKAARKMACENQCLSCEFVQSYCRYPNSNDGSCVGYKRKGAWKEQIEKQCVEVRKLYKEWKEQRDAKQTRYTVLRRDTYDRLEGSVNEFLDVGYTCVGGLVITGVDMNRTFCQAMVRNNGQAQ